MIPPEIGELDQAAHHRPDSRLASILNFGVAVAEASTRG
jgi:hypothetical protein